MEVDGIDVERSDLVALDAASAGLVVLADRDEAEEELAHHLPTTASKLSNTSVARLLSAPSTPPIPGSRSGQAVARTSIEELGQRVLEERERARLVPDVRDQLAQQGGLERNAGAAAGLTAAASSSSDVSGVALTTPLPESSAELRVLQAERRRSRLATSGPP